MHLKWAYFDTDECSDRVFSDRKNQNLGFSIKHKEFNKYGNN